MQAKAWRGGLNVLLIFVLFFGMTSAARANVSYGETTLWYDRMGLMRQLGAASLAVAVDAQSHYAYFSEGPILKVADISSHPGSVGAVYAAPSAHGLIRAIRLAGNYAYLAADDAGLVIMDISDPTHPRLAGQIDLPMTSQDVAVVGSRAFVANMGLGVLVIDISDPAHPALTQWLSNQSQTYIALAVNGTRLYALSSNSKLMVFDISGSGTIPNATIVDLPGVPMSMALGSGYLYLGLSYTVFTFSLADPANPSVVSSTGLNVSGTIKGMTVSGSTLYVANKMYGLCQISLASPASPTGTCQKAYQPDGYPAAYAVAAPAGAYLYAAYNDGLRIHNRSDLSIAHGYPIQPVNIQSSAYYNGLLYLTAGSRMYITDAAHPVFDTPAATTSDGTYLNRLLLYTTSSKPETTYAFTIRQQNKLGIRDVTDPAHVSLKLEQEVKHGTDSCTFDDVDLSGSMLYYLAHCGGGLHSYLFIYSLVDLPALNSPTVVDLNTYGPDLDVYSWNTLGFPGKTYRYAYVALSENGMMFLDLSDLGNITSNTSNLVSLAYDVSVAPGSSPVYPPSAVYVAQGSQVGVYSLDLQTRYALIPDHSGCMEVLVKDGYLFSYDGNTGIDQYDISDRANPALAGHANISGVWNSLNPGGPGEIYALDAEAGLQIVRMLPDLLYLPMTMR